MNCLCCGRETNNPKYCSRSCSVRESNKKPKRKRSKQCKDCGTPILSPRTRCIDCYKKFWLISHRGIRLSDLQDKAKYQISAQVRNHARTVFSNTHDERKCHLCGYDKHIEVCHIKSINSFPPDAPITEVNDPSNLVGLCPNCHWEFDNGLATIRNHTPLRRSRYCIGPLRSTVPPSPTSHQAHNQSSACGQTQGSSPSNPTPYRTPSRDTAPGPCSQQHTSCSRPRIRPGPACSPPRRKTGSQRTGPRQVQTACRRGRQLYCGAIPDNGIRERWNAY